ncbi:hypothetical protein [Streptomyces sp. 7-21]|uniref:hypothetical protein n=1 Tax=Streptomyces sp. 7-21 TaxID=2802283 RepID=UPI00191FD076|nr:hypothetical protein [Streptomyces sp. 7-21]MBL1066814.1 hypothetical protein [Streptomyces sp. 7-21]
MAEPGARRWTTGFSLFGEILITGVVVAVLSLPVVTALPAVAAGVAHLRRHVTGRSVRMADLLRDFAAAWRALWAAAAGFTLVALLLLWNLSLGQAGVVPGSGGVRVASLVLLAALAVLLLRTAAAWEEGPREAAGAAAAGALVRAAAQRAAGDVSGSVLLAFACVMCGVFVWMLLPLLLVTGGLLALATVAVEHRRQTRQAGDGEPAEEPGAA